MVLVFASDLALVFVSVLVLPFDNDTCIGAGIDIGSCSCIGRC